jgi:hypothetical protein
MRVDEAGLSIFSSLVALPWCPSYLAAMWILCGELQSLYAPWIEDDEVPLMASTMDLVREVVIAGESPQTAVRAWELVAVWEPVIDEPEPGAPEGPLLLNVLGIFQSLAVEIAEPGGGRYDSANWVPNAVEDRWRDWDDPGPIYLDPNEPVDDSSPLAQTFARFGRVISEVAAWQGPDWDPVRIRAQIFDQQ